MHPVNFDKLKKGDRVVVWDPAQDALHTDAQVAAASDGARVKISIGGLAPAGMTRGQVARFVFLPADRAIQLAALDRRIDHNHRMLVLREEQLRTAVWDESIRAEALLEMESVKLLRELRDRVESGAVLK